MSNILRGQDSIDIIKPIAEPYEDDYVSTYHSKSYDSSSAGNSESTNRSYSNHTKKNSSGKKTYDSYDEGYDDIYMDGDYDYDRYDSDSDYADGVDDAMDETGEDW